jgi:REP element-mobilizing transposase RayT
MKYTMGVIGMTDNKMSGNALVPGAFPLTDDPIRLFITWTTYGTWLPGDDRGWRKWKSGQQHSQPLLEEWCHKHMKAQPLVLTRPQRQAVEKVIREHSTIRGWELAAVSARLNHVHVAVTVVPIVSGKALAAGKYVKNVRDQLKANSTRVLRQLSDPITHEKSWTKGGDIQFIDSDEDWEQVILYITVAQDRMGRGK